MRKNINSFANIHLLFAFQSGVLRYITFSYEVSHETHIQI